MISMDKFTPTPDMIAAARAVFMAQAWLETVKPVVRSYQVRILQILQAPLDAHWLESGMEPRIILDPKDTYLMPDAAFKVYQEESNKARLEAGLEVSDPEFCPLLVAEDQLSKAQAVLVEAMEPITHLSHSQIFQSPNALENYDKLVNLTLRLLAPFVEVV